MNNIIRKHRKEMNIVYGDKKIIEINEFLLNKLSKHIDYFDSVKRTPMNKSLDMKEFGLGYEESIELVMNLITNRWDD